MDAFKKGWFTETGTLNSDVALSIEVDEILHREKSEFQDILVFQRQVWIYYMLPFVESKIVLSFNCIKGWLYRKK